MDLSLRSLTAAPLQMQRRGTHKEPFSCCATSQLCLLAQKSRTRVVRCSIAEEGREPAQESSPAKAGAPASWLQADAASDPFFGWTSDNSQTNHSSKAGWIKVGGGVVLAIGFALGAQAFYARRGATKISAALLPVTEQIISSPKTSESSEKQGVLDQDRQLQTDGAVPKVQQEESTSAGLPKTLGRVLVPASVDHMQEQLLAALQALKVIEAGVQPGDICTRREYARWLIAASARLSRSPADKVFPAMYIENVSRLAYADVLPEDRDFPYIQGLAEAGLITSRLLGDDTQQADDGNSVFSPDSPLTRQDLIAWKGAFERKTLISPEVSSLDSKKALQELSGFVDADKIRQDAWPALLADINAGKCSIIASAFGYTRRFQPEKPVTNAQAAVALATGDAWELVSEELARLEAESIAEAAVVAELAMETKAQEEVAAAFNELLQAEREKLQESASLVEKLQAELEQVKTDWEEEKYALLKERAALDSEKEILSNTRREVEQQALLLSNAKLELSFQREQVDKLHTEAEEERAMTSKIRSELEVEKNALTLARAWAEEEARRALVHSKLLEQVRARWEYQGVQVHVDKELDEVNIPGPSWRYSEDFHSRSSPMDRLVTKSKDTINSLVTKSTDIGHVLKDTLLRFFHFIVLICQAIRTRSTELARGLREKLHEAKINLADSTTNTMAGIKQTLPSSVTDMTASIREGTLKAATDMTVSIREGTLKAVADCKGGAERLAHKFKVS